MILVIKKGLITPNLPENVIDLNNRLYIRGLRVLGGVSTICLLGQEQLKLTLIEILLAMSIGIIYLIYGVVITVIR